jgi:hypothetical protein
MGRQIKHLKDLDNYARILSRDMHKSESINTHVLLSYLFFYKKIKPWRIIPQPHSKRGIIDFMYFPENEKYNIFIEMKRFRTLDDSKYGNELYYLTGGFPDIPLDYNRVDETRLLLITDLRKLFIAIRQTKWGEKTRSYFLPVKEFQEIKECIDELDLWLKKDSKNAARIILWDDIENRLAIVYHRMKRKEFSNIIYNEWLSALGEKGRKGMHGKFKQACKVKFKKINQHANPNYLDALERAFNGPKTKDTVREVFEEKGVGFSKGPLKSIFAR